MEIRKRAWSPPQLIWSALIAIIVWSAVGFNWFGYGFNWTTRVNATRMTDEVVTENLAGICVAQARHGPEAAAALKKLMSLDSWKRREFVETSRWSVMPGSDSSKSGVSDRCVEKLLST